MFQMGNMYLLRSPVETTGLQHSGRRTFFGISPPVCWNCIILRQMEGRNSRVRLQKDEEGKFRATSRAVNISIKAPPVFKACASAAMHHPHRWPQRNGAKNGG